LSDENKFKKRLAFKGVYSGDSYTAAPLASSRGIPVAEHWTNSRATQAAGGNFAKVTLTAFQKVTLTAF